MAAAAYRHLARELDLPDLVMQADLIRETTQTPGWGFLVASIAEHKRKMLDQLLHETTKADDVPRLRGLVNGLGCVEEAAEAILSLAKEREAEAKRNLEHSNA